MDVLLITNWWALALRGIVAILFGLAAFLIPGITIAALVLLFAAYAFVDGVFSLAGAVQGPRGRQRWWGLFLEGLAGIGIGVLAFVWPAVTALALVYLIAAWAVLTGVLEIVAAVRLRKEITGEWLLALAGGLSVVFGLLLFAAPGAGAVALVWLIGAYALLFGALLLVLAFRMREWRRGIAAPRAQWAA